MDRVVDDLLDAMAIPVGLAIGLLRFDVGIPQGWRDST